MDSENTKVLIQTLPAILIALGGLIASIIAALYARQARTEAKQAHTQSKENAVEIQKMGKAFRGEREDL